MLGLNSKDYEILNTILIMPLKSRGCRLWVFGSRARGDYKEYSDIDLLYEAKADLPLGLIYDIKTQLEDSNLSIKVDLVDVKDLAESYKHSVFQDRLEIY